MLTSEERIFQLRQCLLQAFAAMDEVSATIHPWAVEDFLLMAELLGIDVSKVPTEGRALSQEL